MTRLTLVVFTAYAVIYSIVGVAEPAEEPQNEINLVEEAEAEFRAGGPFASPHAHANAIPSNNIAPRPRQNPVDPKRGPVNTVSCYEYACTNCPKVHENSTEVKYCLMSQDPTKADKCVVYAEKFKHLKTPWYIRGCASERGSCAEIRQSHKKYPDVVELVSCDECSGDKCNMGGIIHFISHYVLAFFVVVVTPALGKYTLS